MAYVAGNKLKTVRYSVIIKTDDGLQGEYVTHWGGTLSSIAQSRMLAPLLIGRDPEEREVIYDDLKRDIRAYDHMGHGPLDIALWDLVGKMYNTSVKKLLGCFRKRLTLYASSYHGQLETGGLDSIDAFADYAEQCKEKKFSGFKIHGWNEGDAKKEADNITDYLWRSRKAFTEIKDLEPMSETLAAALSAPLPAVIADAGDSPSGGSLGDSTELLRSALEYTNHHIWMTILDVDKSRTVVVIKRSLSPGFAGIPNPLFAADNSLMYFGSAKEAVLDLVAAVKEG